MRIVPLPLVLIALVSTPSPAFRLAEAQAPVANSAPADSGLELLRRARGLLAGGSTSGIAAYYTGAVSDDPATVAEYLKDLSYILSPGERDQFLALRGAERVAWLRAFWSRRDDQALRDQGERLMEHYRRIAYTREHFPLPPGPRQYKPWDNVRTGATEFDDRGVIYVRHGPPSMVAGYESDGPSLVGSSSTNMLPNTTWRYVRPEGDLIFTFRACATLGARGQTLVGGPCPHPRDYRLVESPLDLLHVNPDLAIRVGQLRLDPAPLETSGALSLPGRAEPDPVGRPPTFLWQGAQTALLSRRRISPEFAQLLAADRYTAPQLAGEVREAGKRWLASGLSTDSYEHEYQRTLATLVEVLAAGREADSTLLHVTWAIRGKELLYTRRGADFLLPLRVRVLVTTPDSQTVRRFDTTTTFRASAPVPRNESMVGRVALRVPPGNFLVRILLENDPLEGIVAGARTPSIPVDVPATDGADLALSDVILGAQSVPLMWRRPDADTVWFNPTGRFFRDEPLQLFYEVYGLPAGAEYQTELAISRVKGGEASGEPALRLGFIDRVPGPIAPVARTVDLTRLEPGDYELTVTITDGLERVRSEKRRFGVTSER